MEAAEAARGGDEADAGLHHLPHSVVAVILQQLLSDSGSGGAGGGGGGSSSGSGSGSSAGTKAIVQLGFSCRAMLQAVAAAEPLWQQQCLRLGWSLNWLATLPPGTSSWDYFCRRMATRHRLRRRLRALARFLDPLSAAAIQPPVPVRALAEVEAALQVPLPWELYELYRWCDGQAPQRGCWGGGGLQFLDGARLLTLHEMRAAVQELSGPLTLARAFEHLASRPTASSGSGSGSGSGGSSGSNVSAAAGAAAMHGGAVVRGGMMQGGMGVGQGAAGSSSCTGTAGASTGGSSGGGGGEGGGGSGGGSAWLPGVAQQPAKPPGDPQQPHKGAVGPRDPDPRLRLNQHHEPQRHEPHPGQLLHQHQRLDLYGSHSSDSWQPAGPCWQPAEPLPWGGPHGSHGSDPWQPAGALPCEGPPSDVLLPFTSELRGRKRYCMDLRGAVWLASGFNTLPVAPSLAALIRRTLT